MTDTIHVLSKDNASINDPADLTGMTQLRIGVSWDASARNKGGLIGKMSRKAGADLDLFAIVMQGNDPVRFAGLDNVNPIGDGSLVHSGDNTTGQGDGDDETIDAFLTRLPQHVTGIIFTVAVFKNGGANKAFKDKGFEGAQNVAFSVYDASGGEPEKCAEIWPSLLGTENCCLVAKAWRVGASWKLAVLNEMVRITPGDQRSLLRACLNR